MTYPPNYSHETSGSRQSWGKGDPDTVKAAALRLVDDWKAEQRQKSERGTESDESHKSKSNGKAEGLKGLDVALSLKTWLTLELPTPESLLGDIITSGVRMFLVGKTGLGKTLLGVAMAVAMGSGKNLLNWKAARAARILYIDGEMPPQLLQQRLRGEVQRAGASEDCQIFAFSSMRSEEVQKLFPDLPPQRPLNTEEGLEWLRALVEYLKPDAVVLDNVMSMTVGDQKDEVTWSGVLPVVDMLTAKNIAQIWLDHTGWNTDRQYGSSTKAWRFDVMGVMTPVAEDRRGTPSETAFVLSFDMQDGGKARLRTPDNWDQFAKQIIRLDQGNWTTEPFDDGQAEERKQAAKPARADKPPKPLPMSPTEKTFHQVLREAIAVHGTGRMTTVDVWLAACIGKGMIQPPPPNEKYTAKDKREGAFRVNKSKLAQKGFIQVEFSTKVTDLVPL